MAKKIFVALIACALTLMTGPASGAGGPGDEKAAKFTALFNCDESGFKAGDFFAGAFIKQVPEEKIRAILKEYKSKLGAFRSALSTGDESYTLLFEKGKAPSKIYLDKGGLIAGIWFGPPALLDDSAGKIAGELKDLEGTVSVAIIRNGSDEVFALNPDEPLGVGSAFKLFVLRALVERFREGAEKPESVVLTDKKNFSLPTGTLQDWPDATPMTLRSVANLMISISDNTATDTLIDRLGRRYVEKFAPARIRPFLKTVEMFKIKWALSKKEQDEYLAADEAGRREILEKIASIDRSKIKPDLSAPAMIDRVEWHATAPELCDVIYRLRDDPSIAINPGLASRDEWKLIGFKGGSEPGVLNFTHLLQKKDGSDFYAISATVNNATSEVQTEKFSELVARLISLLGDGRIGAGK